MLFQDWVLTLEQLQWLLNYHPWLKCYSCHMLSGELPYEDKKHEIIGIAFIRDPVDRIISMYRHQINPNYKGGFAKQQDLNDFIDNALVKGNNRLLRNGQTNILGGSADGSGLKKIEDRINKGHLILLRTDRFDESCILLEKLFPSDFTNCAYLRYNVSKNKINISIEQKEKIKKYMYYDYRLLKIAGNYMDSSLAKYFSEKSEIYSYIEDFEKRCRVLRNNKRILDFLKLIESKLYKIIN